MTSLSNWHNEALDPYQWFSDEEAWACSEPPVDWREIESEEAQERREESERGPFDASDF